MFEPEQSEQDVRPIGRTTAISASPYTPGGVPEPHLANEGLHTILDIAYAFRASKALLAAVELDVFTILGSDALPLETLTNRLVIHRRGARDFLDALVALRLLERDADGFYSNAAACAVYLDRNKSTYIGAPLEQLNNRLYATWERLTEALRTGLPQSGVLGDGGYSAFYSDQNRGSSFLRAMTGGTLLPARRLALTFPWERHKRLIDVGTAEGCFPVEIIRSHPHLIASGFDLPEVAPAFASYVARHGMSEQLQFHAGNFLTDQLPQGDVLVMGRILHNWDLTTKKVLLKKAFEALDLGGSLIVYDPLIDDARRTHAHGLLSSLNMLIETSGGFEYTGADCVGWMEEQGFRNIRVELLVCGHFAVIARKPT